ncbi:MAG: hypothetical protein KGJ62_03930 [Armatimonadetes bacterium]|nr:hypothetical protein [Armatimonadota bacterium]MDE2208005.1 hypothetical protein [Armatimonadota bacterium]
MDNGTLAIMLSLGIPLAAIITNHFYKLARLRAQSRTGLDSGTRAAIESLRQEVATLRDTTMQYDLSFDTALQRIDSRVTGLERRLSAADPAPVSARIGD